MKKLFTFLAMLLMLSCCAAAQTGGYVLTGQRPTPYDSLTSCVTHDCTVDISSNPSMTQVSVGYDGTLYGRDASRNLWTMPLKTRTWRSSPLSPMNQLSVVSAQNIWALNDDGICAAPNMGIYHYTGGADFVRSGYCATQISAAPDGTVYRVRGTGGTVEQRTSTGSWIATTGAGGNGTPVKVAVGSAANVWRLTSTGVFKKLNANGAFVVVSGWASDITVGSYSDLQSTTWIVGTAVGNKNLYKMNKGDTGWTLMTGWLQHISASGAALLVGNDGLYNPGHVYHFNMTKFVFQATVSGSYTCPPNGCPNGSYHTITVNAHFRTRGWDSPTGSAGGSPTAQLSTYAITTTSQCDTLWLLLNDPACIADSSGSATCSVMGNLFSDVSSVIPYFDVEVANSFLLNAGVDPAGGYFTTPSCSNVAVQNWGDIDFLPANGTYDTYAPAWDAFGLCERVCVSGLIFKWHCVPTLAFKVYGAKSGYCSYNPVCD